MKHSASVDHWKKMHRSMGYEIDPLSKKLVRNPDIVEELQMNERRRQVIQDRASDAGL